MIEDYFEQVELLVRRATIVHSSSITYDKRSAHIGFVRGEIYFLDGSLLHVREFVNVERGVERYTYGYHYQRTDGSLVFRYDDTPHFPDLPSFPHHKHENSESNVMPAAPQDLGAVLAEIHRLMASSTL